MLLLCLFTDAYAHRAGRAGRPGCAVRGASLLLPPPGPEHAAAVARLERDAKVAVRRLTAVGEREARGRSVAAAAAASAAAASRSSDGLLDGVGVATSSPVSEEDARAARARLGERMLVADRFGEFTGELSELRGGRSGKSGKMANVPKTVAPAKELWARLRKTFFVERWRRSIHGLDLLRCFTADELRTALRHPRTREQTLDVGKSVTIEGDAKDLRVIVVLSGSLKVYLRSAEVTEDGRTKRASNPLIDASRLSYTGGVTSIGSRSGKRLAIAPKEATHVRVGSVPERGTFGSMQALTGKKWDKTAVCAERDTRILSIPAAAFAVVIGDRPSVTDELARVIAWRRKVEAATADASAAAMEAASRGSSRDEVLAAAAAVVPKPPSQAEIAALAEEIAMFVGC